MSLARLPQLKSQMMVVILPPEVVRFIASSSMSEASADTFDESTGRQATIRRQREARL
jgi:hypothetical protein